VAISEYELEDVLAPPAHGNEEEEADKFLEIGMLLYYVELNENLAIIDRYYNKSWFCYLVIPIDFQIR